MALIDYIDGATRKIYLDPLAAISGEIAFHPVDDLYKEYRAQRRLDESLRRYDPLLLAAGNVAKGGGKYTPRYTMLLNGSKVVIPDGVSVIRVTGELLTDDQTDQFDTSLTTGPVTILYQPSDAEVIKVNTTGGTDELILTADQLNAISDKVWTRAIDNGLTAEMIQRVLISMLAGKVSGAGTGTETFRNLADTKARVVVNADSSGNRTQVTIDGT